MQQVRVPDAERCYREAARFAPGEPRARIGLVACLIEQERNEEGLAESERLARDFPQLPASAECFAEALVANGRGELALGVIDPCISRHGASPWRHGLRGRACESIGDQAGALAAFEAAWRWIRTSNWRSKEDVGSPGTESFRRIDRDQPGSAASGRSAADRPRRDARAARLRARRRRGRGAWLGRPWVPRRRRRCLRRGAPG